MTTTERGVDAALAYLRDHADEHLAGLDEFLRIPSVSADPERKGEVRRAAQWIADELTRIGAEHAQLTDTSSHPIVTADWLHAGPDAPTVLVYCHYDVQPPDPLDEWVRPPFEPRYEDDIVSMRAARATTRASSSCTSRRPRHGCRAGGLPLNLRFFFEGDEEVGSLPVGDLRRRRTPSCCRPTWRIVSDSDMHDDEGTPAITYGLRGIAYWEVKVFGPFQDLHSGPLGGGCRQPGQRAGPHARLPDRWTRPGHRPRLLRPRPRPDRRGARGLRRTAVRRGRLGRADQGSRGPMDGEPGYTLLERLSARPTFDVNGLWGGYSGEGSKTIIPAFAGAKISTRLVPDQDHREIEQLMVEHLQRIAPPTVRVEVKVIQGGQPVITPLDHPAVALAARALRAGLRQGAALPPLGRLDPGRGRDGERLGLPA